jgi:hypothetical protein
MVELAQLQAIAYVAQTLGVIGTLTAAFIAVRSYINANKRAEEARARELETRHAQLFMGIYQNYFQPAFGEADHMLPNIQLKNAQDYKELLKDKEKSMAFGMFAVYYEGIGVLVKENLIDIRLVALLLSGNISWFWDTYGEAIKDSRREFNWPRFFIEIEYLYDRIVEYAERNPELSISVPTHN